MTPATPRRARREPADRRRELLDAARAETAAVGLDHLGAAAVATRAGASKALVYHYFGTGTGLRRAVALAAVADLDAALAGHDAVPLAQRPRRVVRAFLDAVLAERATWTSIWRGVLADDPETRDALAAVRAALVERMAASASTHGLEVTPRLRLLAGGWVALVENVTAAWLDDDAVDRDSLERLVVRSVAVLAPELPGPQGAALVRVAEGAHADAAPGGTAP